jgi:ParB family chromosome partitioning protein
VSKGLGRGLGALLGGDDEPSNETSEQGQKTLSLQLIRPNPNQPRKEFNDDALKELTASIKEKGIIQPILVEPEEDGKYLIVAGERRYRAATAAGLNEVPVVVRKFSEVETLEIALIENIQRQDLTPVEEAQAFKHLMDTYGYSQDEVAKKVSKSRSAVANALRILKLPLDMLEALTRRGTSARVTDGPSFRWSIPQISAFCIVGFCHQDCLYEKPKPCLGSLIKASGLPAKLKKLKKALFPNSCRLSRNSLTH